jgi:hypothetical protein
LHRQRANYLLAVLIIYVRLFMKLLNFCWPDSFTPLLLLSN